MREKEEKEEEGEVEQREQDEEEEEVVWEEEEVEEEEEEEEGEVEEREDGPEHESAGRLLIRLTQQMMSHPGGGLSRSVQRTVDPILTPPRQQEDNWLLMSARVAADLPN
ncbi:hypothetical protein NHX12_003368 [Muraenolepis orangiensis]|uniref:Uncharacterized protein n=1 Tax=Muraenolepis orangiensis TaxID=630683 RepID=A0A9Q0IGE7_9TELE|nr:hypothetical protein NHX12_003368 [Muraenolepis orangiensis]